MKLFLVSILLSSLATGYILRIPKTIKNKFSLKDSFQNFPKSNTQKLKKSIIESTSIFSSILLTSSTISYAKTFEPIERGQRPDISEAAIPPPTGNLPDFKKVRKDLKDLIEGKPDKGPTLVRLAWHSSGTVRITNIIISVNIK